MSNNNGWHLSKTVPISIVGGLLVQTAALVYWGAGLAKDVEDNTDRAQENTLQIRAIQANRYTEKDAALLEKSIEINNDNIEQIKRVVEKNAESSYRIEKKMDVFIGSHKDRSID